jgi:hypothetical protein
MTVQHCTFDVAGERQQSAVEPWAPSTPAVLPSSDPQAEQRKVAPRPSDGLIDCICVAPATARPRIQQASSRTWHDFRDRGIGTVRPHFDGVIITTKMSMKNIGTRLAAGQP